MTTLAGFQGNGFAIIGADSRATDESGSIFILANKKVVWDNGENYLLAISGATRGGNLIQQGWTPPIPPEFESINKLDQFITQSFLPHLRSYFIDSGFDSKSEASSAVNDSAFLVAVQGVIYPINEDYGWDRDKRNLYVFGSGGDITLGSMLAQGINKCANNPIRARKIITKAIEHACLYNAYCSPPIIIETQYFY